MKYRDLIGYEGTYTISENGDVKRIRTGRIIKAQIVKGYYNIELCQNGIRKRYNVHRLVALTFCENQYNKPQVNHIDGNKLNNHCSNLEWVTSKENTQHAVRIGLKKGSEKQKMAASKNFTEYNQKATIDLMTGIVFDSLKIACESTNFNYTTAVIQIYRKSKSCRFKYV